MNEAYSHLENLVQGSLQIADHMQIDPASAEQLNQIKDALQHMYKDCDDLSRSEGNSYQHQQMTADMHSRLQQINEILEPLKQDLAQRYQQETNDNPSLYEAQSLHNQMENKEAYHGKIDFLSIEKLQENMDKIDAELKSLEGVL